MVWGGITEPGRTTLVVVAGNLTGIRYQDEIVQRCYSVHPSSGQQCHIPAGKR